MSDFTKLGDYELSKLEITSHNGFKQSVSNAWLLLFKYMKIYFPLVLQQELLY